MAAKLNMYPASHRMVLERVMSVIDLIAARSDIPDEDIVAALVQGGVDTVDAELLVRFVPCALSFALLDLMGCSKFPSVYRVYNTAGELVEFPFAEEHYFSVALSVGYDVTSRGYNERVSKKTFRAATLRSAEMNAVNEFFSAGHTTDELKGGGLSTPIFIGVTAEQITASR